MSVINHYICKSCKNQNDNAQFTWWKTNFNMPVPYLFTATPTWTEYVGPINFYQIATSFDLTGFSEGYETVAFFSNFHFDGPQIGTSYLYQQWLDNSSNILVQGANGIPVSISLSSGYWYEYVYGLNIGAKSIIGDEEVSASGNYQAKSWVTGFDPSTKTTTVAFSNVPASAQLGSTKPGYIWVEGANLCYVNAYQWKHTMVGTDQGYKTTNYGSIWLDTSDNLNWIGNDGHQYTAKWKIKQFASTWSNGPSGSTYAGASKVGTIWVDNEFGQTHLAYIASDGYKYLTGAGDYSQTSTP